MLTKESSGQFSGGHPFDNIIDILEKESVQYVGKQNFDGVETNVFRNIGSIVMDLSRARDLARYEIEAKIVRTCTTRGTLL